MEDVYLIAGQRTPVGSFLGSLSTIPATVLGAKAIAAALARANVPLDAVNHVMMGNVLQAGLGQAPARQASIYAGLPLSVGATTLNKVCGSGLRSVMDGANGIQCGEWDIVVAGGMESMSNAPHLLLRGRGGTKMGDINLVDSMVKDGIWDPYHQKHMGECAEFCIEKYKISRQDQDAAALRSYDRARSAQKGGLFHREIVVIADSSHAEYGLAGKGAKLNAPVNHDEEPFKAPLEKVPHLKPHFSPTGTLTAANASKLNDGGAACVMASGTKVKELGLTPMARIVSQASFAADPQWFSTAPPMAIRNVLKRANMSLKDIDAFEIHEAFAVVLLMALQDLQLDANIVNMRGGAVALGHPIGCSGARMLVTLMHILSDKKLRYGCAAICIGGGEAVAMIIENLR